MTKTRYKLKDFIEIKTSLVTSFSPDSEKVTIRSNKTGTSQLYIANRDGTELEQITFFDDNVNFGSYSPTKNEIIFGMTKGGDENTQLYLYDVAKKRYVQLTDNPKVRFGWGGWSRDGKNIAFSSNERNGVDFDVYIMDIVTNEVKCVFQKDGWCTSSGFSPIGRYLIVNRMEESDSNELYLVDLNNNSYEKVASSDGETTNYSPGWLPDESGFYYLTNQDREFLALSFFELETKNRQYVLESDWDMDDYAITKDGEYLAVRTNEDGYDKLVIYRVDGFRPIKQQAIPKGTSYGFGWSRDGKYLLVNVESAISLTCSWIWSRCDDTSEQITKAISIVPEDIYVEPEIVHYKSFDGLEIPALLYVPKDISIGNKLPVIINIHGGPEAQSTVGFASLTQYLLQAGYAVVFPNVRGSTGYGKKYMHLDDVEKRMDSVLDIVSLRDYLSSRSEMDVDKIALLGGSYGGYMVLAGLAFHPDLWAAGVDMFGISNLVSFLENTAAYRRGLRESEYGSLAKDGELLKSISPYNYADKIKAPLLIVQGENDPRVPLSEAEQMHEKLKHQGNRVELLVYPDEGHGISKLKNRLDLWPKVVGFLDEVLSYTPQE